MASDLLPGPSEPEEISTIDLPPSAQARPARVVADFGGVTHPGRKRENNEDQYLIARLSKGLRVLKTSIQGQSPHRFSREDAHLLIVADGLGGAAAGERASTLAIESVETFSLEVFKWFLRFKGSDKAELLDELRLALEDADQQVYREAVADRRLSGMGTTLTMAYLIGPDAFIVHAGDSRAYLLRGGELLRLTHDHTYVQMLLDAGTITPDDARNHRRRHVVTNVVGGPEPGVYAEIHKVRIEDGDVLLLCTDGLTEPVTEDEIRSVLIDTTRPQEACDRLLELALDRGAPDNVTLVVARFLAEPDRDSSSV